jgi:long-chain fatty acid transport protein
MKNFFPVKILVAGMVLSALTYADASRLHQEDGIYPNQSAEYVRTLNRNASRDADAAFYNPAGLAFMEQKGLHVMFSSQTYYARREHTQDYYAIDVESVPGGPVETAHRLTPGFKSNLPDEYYAETTAPCLPDFNVIWKDDSWAAFFSFAVMQAAPSMTYPYGLAVIDFGMLATPETMLETYGSNDLFSMQRNAEAIRDEMYLGGTVGFSYKLHDSFSAALAVRYIHMSGKMQVHVTDIEYYADWGSGPTIDPPDATLLTEWNLETDTRGHGAGVIAGMHFRPGELVGLLKGMDVGFRYEYYAPMVLQKNTVHFMAPALLEKSGKLDIFKDGSKSPDGMAYTSDGGNGQSTLKVTYPQSLSLGISYPILKNLRAEVSGEITLRQYRDLDGREDAYNLGYRAGGCLEWAIMPKVKLSAGYLYNNFGIKPEKRDEADPLLESHTVGGGFGFKVDDRLDISVGFFKMFFVKETQYTTEFTNVSGPVTHYLKKSFDENRFSTAIGITYRLFGGAASGETNKGGTLNTDKG